MAPNAARYRRASHPSRSHQRTFHVFAAKSSARRLEKDRDETTKKMAMMKTVIVRIRWSQVNIDSLYRCFRAASCWIVPIFHHDIKHTNLAETSEISPFKEYMIHIKNVLRVIARGIMKSRSTSAEVDSSSSSTIPTAYNTGVVLL